MTDVMCSECLLTPSGDRLLTIIFRELECTRPDDPTWYVNRCTSCGQPRSIHDDLDGWTFGDAIVDDDWRAPTILHLAPEWITVREATYAAHVPEGLILEWAESGRVESVTLLPSAGSVGILVRTADIRASLTWKDQTSHPDPPGEMIDRCESAVSTSEFTCSQPS